MYILNTMMVDRNYSNLDVGLKVMKPIDEFGFNERFYGGRVTHIAEVKDNPNIMLLLSNKYTPIKVIDVAAKDLMKLTWETLKTIVEGKGIEINPENKITKDGLIKLIENKLLKIA